MIVATGKSILKGIAIGKIKFLKKAQAEISEAAADAATELQRFEDAKAQAVEQLQALYDKAVVEAGEDHAAIFEIHMMMLDDDDYLDSIHEIIQSQGKSAEYAVKKASADRVFCRLLRSSARLPWPRVGTSSRLRFTV